MSSSKRKLLVASAALILLSGISALYFYFQEQTSLDALPNLDFNGVEKQVAEKLQLLREQVEQHPGSSAAWGKFAMNLDIHDFKRESIPCYQQAAKLDPDDFRWAYYAATALRETGSQEAIQWFEYCQALNPDYLPFHILNGMMMLNHGRLQDAADAFQNALNTDSKSSHAYLGLGQVALARDDLALSKKHLLKAVEINPTHREVYGRLAEVYEKLNAPEKAAEAKRMAQQFSNVTRLADPLYAELVAEGESSYWYLIRGQRLNEKGHFPEAAEEFTLALKANPRAEAHYGLGFALQQMGNYEAAVSQYQAAIDLNPAYRDAHQDLAVTMFKMGNADKAIAQLETVIQVDPAFPGGYLNQGIYLISLGKDSEAVEVFRQGIENAPFDIRIANKLAWLLATSPKAALRNGEEAVRLAEKSCKLTNYRVPQNLDILAAAYAETMQFKKAEQIAQQAQQLAITAGQLDLADGIQSRLAMYEQNRAFRVKRF